MSKEVYRPRELKVVDIPDGGFKIESTYPLWKRIWVLIKNPFTYIFCGYIEH